MRDRLWNRGGWAWLGILCLVAVFAQSALHLIRPVTSYKILELDGSATTIGLTTAVYALLPVVVAPSVGRLSDRTAWLWRWMVLGVGTMALGSALLTIAPGMTWVMVGSALLGVGHLMLTVCLQAVIARRAPQGRLAAGFGWFTAANSVGQMVGPFLGGWLVEAGPAWVGDSRGAIDLALAGGLLFAVLTVPIILVARREFTVPVKAPGSQRDGGQGAETSWSLIRRPKVGVILYCSLGFVALVDILTAFMPLIGEERGIPPIVIGAILAVRGGSSFASRAVLPWLTARYSGQKLLIVSLLGSALCFAVMPFVVELMWLATVLAAAGGLALGIGQPVTMAMISVAVPFESRGQALALRLVSSRFGQVVIPLGAGGLAGAFGPVAAVQLAVFVLLSATAVSGKLNRP